MLAPGLYKVPSAVSSSLTRQRSEADLITGERTPRPSVSLKQRPVPPSDFFFFISLFYTRASFTPALLWTVERAPPSKKFSRCLKVSTGRTLRSDPDQASPGANEKVASQSHFELLRPPPSKLCHSTGIPLAEEKDERNKQKE